MPLSASLLGGTYAAFTTRKHARAAVQRLPRSAAAAAAPEHAPELGAKLLHMETSVDGTVTYCFGTEGEEVAAASAAASTAQQSHVAPAAAAAAALDAAAATQHHAPLAAHQMVASAVAGGAVQLGANGAVNGGASAAAAAAVLSAAQPSTSSTAEAAAQLEELLQRSSSSDEDEVGSSLAGLNGSANGTTTGRSSMRRQRTRQEQRSAAPTSLAAAAAAAVNGASTHKRKVNGRGSNRSANVNGSASPQQHAQQQQGSEQQQPGMVGGPGGERGPDNVEYLTAKMGALLQVYDGLCETSQLDEALHFIQECIHAERSDVLTKLRHHHFLRPAASRKAVKQALRFVQLLPRQCADARTYNMVLRVCAAAGDLHSALMAVDMLRMAGLKMDAILYTTLISTCAAAGDAEKAFQLFGEMKESRVQADKMVYSSVVKACAEHIHRLPPSERRQQLVLLERAFNLVEDMKGARIPTDAAVWNALVTAAGRAGQLQRAFNVLEDMLDSGIKPNDRTYASLIDACGRAGDKAFAMRVYKKALREGCGTTLMVYSAAVNACINAREGCDAETAMSVYNDMQRNRVEPDNQLYGRLMMAAGRAGDLVLVKELAAEMAREGLRPCAGTQSALMAVHIQHSQLTEAQAIYRRLRAAGQWPNAYALNALMNAYANNFRLGDVVSLVCDMREAGMQPDAFTFSAIFNACQRADEAELALDVARLMKRHGVRMDETHAMILLRICYNRLRQAWVPGGYPPNRLAAMGAHAAGAGLPGRRRNQERQRLLEALTPAGRRVDLREPADVAWLAQAFGVYREALSSGVRPTMRLLNRALMCLRVEWEGKQAAAGASDGAPVAGTPEALLPHTLAPMAAAAAAGAAAGAAAPGAAAVGGGAVRVPRQEKIGVERVYHTQAISIMEEAMISNVVPSFTTDRDEAIDLRGMPPAVAEVYVLTVLSAIQRQCEARRVITQNLCFLVPTYDGSKVFLPSHMVHATYASDTESSEEEEPQQRPGKQASRPGPYDSDEEEGVSFADADAAFARASRTGTPLAASALAAAAASPADATSAGGGLEEGGDERTGLGVAGVLRRLRLWAREYGDRGFLLLEAKELTRWCKAQQRAAERRSASALPVQKPYGQPVQTGRMGLQQQQRQIRLGL